MTHGHAELEPQVISANPTVEAGTLNAYERLAFKKWPLYDTHDCGELHQMQEITGLTLLSPIEIIFFLPIEALRIHIHIYVFITYITYILL